MSIDIVTHTRSSSDFWGTSKFNFKSLPAPVTALYFVAHTNEDNQQGDHGEAPTNHWTVFLDMGNDNSVRMEVVPDRGGQPGMVVLDSKNYAITRKHVHAVTVVPATGTTVQSILEVLISKGRDKYIFSAVGEGCRFWLKTLASDLVGYGIIAQADASKVHAALGKYWPDPRGSAPVDRSMEEGQFF